MHPLDKVLKRPCRLARAGRNIFLVSVFDPTVYYRQFVQDPHKKPTYTKEFIAPKGQYAYDSRHHPFARQTNASYSRLNPKRDGDTSCCFGSLRSHRDGAFPQQTRDETLVGILVTEPGHENVENSVRMDLSTFVVTN